MLQLGLNFVTTISKCQIKKTFAKLDLTVGDR